MAMAMMPVAAGIVVPFHDYGGRRGIDAGRGLERGHDAAAERDCACDDEKECLHAAITADPLRDGRNES
jgi:hypothetical protein